MEQRKMTVQQWAEVMSNPRQRDTEERAKKALRGHLKSSSETQQRVVAAILPGGMLVKLDGHTRSLLWSDGRLTAPDVIYVDLIRVDSMNKAKELYGHFDSQAAVEGAKDRLSGAFREHGIEAASSVLRNGAVTTALKLLSPSGSDIYKNVLAWKRELLMLDSIGATSSRFNSGMISGALAMLRVRGERAIDFIRMVQMDAGTRNEDGSDGVDAIVRYVTGMKGMTGEAAVKDVAGRFITAGESFIAGRRFRQAVKYSDVGLYLDRVRA